MGNKQTKNFFKVPHKFEEQFGNKFSLSEKYFFIILCKLANRFGDRDGKFWHQDKKFLWEDKNGTKHTLGFEFFGLSQSTCKRARKKLNHYNLIEIKFGWDKFGHRFGTQYQINWEIFE